jgi:hypothetical protein
MITKLTLRLAVLPLRRDIRTRLVQVHVLIDMLDPRHRNYMVMLAIW